jgi:RNA polymerase sigma factor (sigma-70 family)
MRQPASSTVRLQKWFVGIKAGEKKARDKLIEHYYERFLAFVRKLVPADDRLRSKENSLDLLHEAFSKRLDRVIQEMDTPQSAEQFWDAMHAEIRRAVQDRARHFFKARRSRLVHLPGTGSASQDPLRAKVDSDPEAAPSKAAESYEMLELIGEVLTEQERRVFDFHVIDEMTWDEIAATTKLEPGTAKKKYFRSVKKLRERLEAKGYGK